MELEPSANYYYDFVAPQAGSATVTVDMTAGQSILLKLGTLDSSWTAPGGELTVDFHFETSGGTVDPDPSEPSEPEIPENALVLGRNDLTSGTLYGYVVPADGRMEFSVGSVYNSAGSKQYSWYNGTKVEICIDGKPMKASSSKFNVTAGQVITVQMNSLDGDTYTADMTLKEVTPAETLVLGENTIEQNLEYVYTAERNGTVYVSVIEMLYNGEAVTESALGNSVLMTINGSSVSAFNKSYEVKTGDEIAIIIKDYSWDGSGKVNTIVNLSYDGFYEHAAGSLMNPVQLMIADCPTDSIEIAAGGAAWYQLEGDPGDYSTPSNYPFKGKYLIVTGENAFVDVDGTVYNAENGMVKVLMGEQILIRIGNAGSAPAVFGIDVEVPAGHIDNPQDLVEGANTVELPSYGTHNFDFTAAEDGTVTVDITKDVDVTNGVVTVTWDPAKLTLTGYTIHADYRSVREDEGSLTFGYVCLSGIAAGKSIATLTFEAVDPADAAVNIVRKQVNNDRTACTKHTWSDWSENAMAQMERECLNCGEKQVNPFIDVSMDAYYLESVLWTKDQNITAGTGNGMFGAEQLCVRAQVVTFLYRAFAN